MVCMTWISLTADILLWTVAKNSLSCCFHSSPGGVTLHGGSVRCTYMKSVQHYYYLFIYCLKYYYHYLGHLYEKREIAESQMCRTDRWNYCSENRNVFILFLNVSSAMRRDCRAIGRLAVQRRPATWLTAYSCHLLWRHGLCACVEKQMRA